jgi:hypothetical protein
MIKTLECIQLSETTVSFRINIDDVNFDEPLNERYQRRCDAIRTKAEKAPQESSQKAASGTTDNDRADQHSHLPD